MFLIQRHVVQSCMKIMFRGLALKCSSFLPKLITGGAFSCALQGSADSNVCMHALVREHVCRDPRECITQHFWQRRRTVLRDPSFGFLLFPHDQSFPATPALVYFHQKINKNKISKDKRHCITICIMEAAKWPWETEPSRKTLPIWTSIPSDVSGVPRCNGTEQATV